MEERVKLYPYQALASADLNAVQDYVQGGLDVAIKELLFDEGRFTGFMTAKTGTFDLTVEKGRYYKGGVVYPARSAKAISLATLAPSSGSRFVLVVATGSEVESSTQSVKFLIDATTRQTQPRPVATRLTRQATVEVIAGAASASPSRPALPAGAIVIAALRLSPAGIVEGPTMETANSAVSLERVLTIIAALQAQDKKTSSLIATLRSDIAALAKAQKAFAKDSDIDAVLQDMLVIKEMLDIPDTASMTGYDDFGTADETDLGASTALLDTGAIRFGEIERTSKLTALLNPADSKLDISANNLILPKSSDILRIESDDRDSEVAIASYSQVVTTSVKKTMTRYLLLTGTKTNSREAVEKRLASKPTIRLFDPATDTWDTINFKNVTWKIQNPNEKDWTTSGLEITQPYWEVGEEQITVTGARVAQTFLCSQSGWHKRIDLGFTDVGGAGDVHVFIRKLTDAGTPDRTFTIASATIPVAQLKKWSTWTPIQFDPFFLERGERYAIELQTTGAHKIGISKSNDLTNGTFMVCTDGIYWSGDLAADMLFRLYGCRFDTTRVVIDIEDITLTGGIRELFIALTGHQPTGTKLLVEGRVGGVWRSMATEAPTIFAQAPTQLPLRFVFVGTKDLMPAIRLDKSRLVASRPRTPSVHLSTARTLPSGATTTTVKVVEEALGFDPTKHDWTVAVITGAGWATTVAASSAKTEKLKGDVMRRTWTFSGLANIAGYKIRTTMTTNDPADTFAIRWRKDWA